MASSLNHLDNLLNCLLMVPEEALRYQVKDAAAFHHFIAQGPDEPPAEIRHCEDLKGQETEKDYLSYLFVISVEFLIGEVQTFNQLFNYLVQIELM